MNPLRRAVEALGADYAHWRVLTRVMLKTDLRSSSAVLTAGAAAKPGLTVPWRIALVYLVFYGGLLALLAALVPNGYVAASLVLPLIAMLVAMAILVDFQSVVISPSDYEILAYQPVSSRTYFLVKLTSILLYTGIIGALLGSGSTVVFLWFGLPVALGWVAAVAGTVVWTSLVMVFAYALVLRVVSPRRLPRVLGYVQIAMMMVAILPIMLDVSVESLLTNMREPPAAMMLLPTTWFANILPLAAGRWSATGVLAVVAAFASIAGLLYFVGRRLSLSYAERLGALLSDSRPVRSRRAAGGFPARWFPEELKVVWTLVRAQFRSDMNFRMGVLAMLPLTFVYVFMALEDGSLPDPFVHVGYGGGGLGLIHFVVVAMPLVLMEHLFRSESHRAAWIFFSTPVDRARLVGHVGSSVTTFFLLPYLAMLAGVFAWTFGNPWHALVHVTVLGLLSHLNIRMVLLVAPRLPFSQPVRKGARIGVFMGTVLMAILALALLPLLLSVYARPSWTVAAIAVLAGASALAPWAVRRAVRGRVEKLEFAG